MKIAIVEDLASELQAMKAAVEAAGHTVLAILPCRPTKPFYEDEHAGLVFGRSFEAVITEIKNFDPDVIIMDHSLERDEYDGETIIKALGIDPLKSIGTSSTFAQKYCGKHFREKSTLVKFPVIASKLLQLLPE